MPCNRFWSLVPRIQRLMQHWKPGEKARHVTMVVRQPDIGARVKYWVRPDIINRIREGSIEACFSSTIAAIREQEVDVQTPQGIVTIANDWVIAMTGYEPNLRFPEKNRYPPFKRQYTENRNMMIKTHEPIFPVSTLPVLSVAEWIPIVYL